MPWSSYVLIALLEATLRLPAELDRVSASTRTRSRDELRPDVERVEPDEVRWRVLELPALESVEYVEREERRSVPSEPFPTMMVRLRLSELERDEVLELEVLAEERCCLSRSARYVRLYS